MNILILSWRGPGHPNAGGAEQVTFEHAKGWTEKGHNVTLFTSYFKGAKKEEEIEGVLVVRCGRQFFEVQLRALIWYVFGRHKKFDLVVDEFHGIPFFTPLYVKAQKFAFIHEVAKDVWKLNSWPQPFNTIPAILGPIFEPLIFKLYTNVPFMTVSKSTKEDLISFGIKAKNIKIIPNGVRAPKATPIPLDKKRKLLLYLGALSKDKGIEDALNVFAEVNRKDNNWSFAVAGKVAPDYLRVLKRISEELGISSKVKFYGYVSEEKKFKLLRSALFLINPSYHEGWGLVNIEANACGTPVVGYKVQGIKDSIKDNQTGILVEKGDYRSMAGVILKLRRDKNSYNLLQRNALSWASKFSWEESKKESLELIESL